MNPSGDPQPSAALHANTAVTMLSLAMNRPKRPVDELIHRLRKSDGPTWLNLAVPTYGKTPPDQIEALIRGTFNLAQMSELKERAKKQIADAPTLEHALASLAVYCLSVAAALAHHDVMISTQSRDEWDALFIDLAEVVPADWRQVLTNAAMSS